MPRAGVIHPDGKSYKNEALEREKAENALKKEEERYRALFQNSPVETLVVDKEAHVTGYNFARERSRGKLPKTGDVMYRDYASNHNIEERLPGFYSEAF